MERDEIRALLAEHMGELRRLVALRRSDVSAQEAAARLDAFWRESCRLARVTSTEELDSAQFEIAVALVRLSRETVAIKKQEFQIHGGLDGPHRPYEDEGGGGGAPIGAWLRPGPPPRSGFDAKSFPPDDVDLREERA